jgi:spermidine/putrescine transport system permease protein
VAFAIGLDRWRGRIAGSFNFQMLLSFVMPEILLAVALLFLVTNLLKLVQLGTVAQLLGLVTFQLSYPAIICRARLLSIGKEYEEAAMDLGASPLRALRHVLLRLLAPAIFASAVLVFADVIDDFVIVRYLSADAASEPMSVKIYNSARSSPTPALNALATIMLASSLLAVGLGALVYRRLTRGERRGQSAVEELAAQV